MNTAALATDDTRKRREVQYARGLAAAAVNYMCETDKASLTRAAELLTDALAICQTQAEGGK